MDFRIRPAVWPLIIAAAAAGCSSDSLTLPSEGLPAAMAVVSGGSQTAQVATPLPDSLRVRVTDSESRPVEGVKVAFTPLLGGGDALPDTGVTNADGRTGTRWVLGTTAGAQRMQAMVTGQTSSGALVQNFDATALAAAADTIFVARGNNQSAEVGAPLADSLVVRVTDRYGNAVSGTAVAWAPTGGGAVSPSSNSSGATGTAATRRTLGSTAGAQGATATASGLKGSPVQFVSTALPAAPTSLAKTAGDNQSGSVSSPLADSVVVRLLDASGNGVPGRNVTFAIATGAGTVSPASATTDAAGRAAARWTLGPVAGGNSLIASSSGFSVTFQATGNSAAATTLLSNSATSQNGTAGLPAGAPPSVRVTDANGNPVAGVSIAFAVSGGGSILPVTPVATNASGIATLTQWVLGTVAGANAVTATAAGLAPSQLTFTATGAAGAAAQLQVQTQPSPSAQSGVALATQPAVRLADVFGNPVAASGTVVTAALALGSGTLGGTLTASTVSGVATFTNLSISGPSGTYAIRFTSGTLTPDTTAAITIGAGAASRLAVVTQPSTTAQNAVAFAQQPRVQVQDAAGNPVAGVRSVTVAINAGGGTLGGTATINTDANGLATFAGLSITGTTGGRTLVFSSTGLTSIVSGTVTITAGAPTQMAVNAGNGQTATAGSAVATAPSVVVRDVSGNPVAGVAVTFAIGIGGGSVLPVAAVNTNASGVAAATSWTLGPAAGANTLTADAAPVGITGDPVTFTATAVAGGAGRLGMVTQPPANATNGVTFTQAPVVQLQDVNGNPVSTAGIAVSVAVASGTGTLNGPPTQATDANGRATFTGLSITGVAGPYTLQFTGASLTGVTSAAVNLVAGPATALAITTQPPATAQSGIAMTPATVVQLQDVSGNAVSTGGVSVTAALVSGGGTLTGTLSTTTAASGAATFSNLILTGAIGPRTIRFTSGSLAPDTSAVITLAAGNAASVAFVQEPTAVVAGAAITPVPSVRVQDGAGNLVTTPAQTVVLSISTNPGGATLSGTTSVATVSGLATFPGLSLNRSGTGYRLRAAAGALVPDTSVVFNVTAGGATTIAANSATTQSDTAGLPVATAPSVLVTDANGNPVAGVAVSFAVTGGGTILPVTPVATNAAGVAALTSWTLGNVTGANAVTASVTGLTGSPVTFTATGVAGAATQLVIQTQPSGAAQSGVAFAVQPAVRLADVFGNTVPTTGTVVTAALASGTGTLGGTLTANTTTGVATFTNLSITGAAGAYTVRFTSGALTPDTSTAVTIGAGAAARLAIVQQPSATVQNAVVLPVQPTVQLVDGAGNPVAQLGTPVTVSILTGGGTLGGTATVNTNAGGLATFTNLSITGTVGARTLLFSSGALVTDTSTVVTVTAGAATQIAINAGSGQSATVNTAVTTPPSVIVRDVSGNAVAGVSVTFAVSTGGGSILPVTPVTTNASGIAALTSWTLGNLAGANSATATSGTLAGSPVTFSATGTAGVATQLQMATQPSPTAQSGVVLAAQPAVRLADAFGNLVNTTGTVITAGFGTGTGTLGGAVTANTASGVATFANLSITGVSGPYTLRFTSGVLTAATSNTITLGAGGAARLGMVLQPSDTAQNAVAFARQPQVQVQDAAGNPVAGVASVTATILTGGGTLLGTATVNTNAAGLATFTNLAIVGTVGARTLRFASGALTTATSATVTITAGAPKLIGVSAGNGQTATAGAAVAVPPAVVVSDTSGNPVPGVAVTFGVAAGGGSVLPVTAVTTGPTGVAAATSWTLGTTAGANSLNATAAPGGISGNPVTFTATGVAGSAGRLAMFTQPPAGAQSGVTVAPSPVVQLQDALGNPVATANVGITASIASGPGGVLSGGTVALTDGFGRATFSTLVITGPTGSYALQFNGASLTGVTSSAITLAPGVAARVTVTAQPATAQSGIAFPTAPAVQVQDAAGNAVTGSGRNIAVTLLSGAATLSGITTQATNASGAATFPGLVLTGPVGANTLLFSSAGLTTDTTSAITLAPGTPASLAYVQQPTTAAAGQVISPSPTVRIRDGAGNTVTTATSAVTLALAANPGGSALGGTTTVNAVAGVATFGTLTLNRTGTGYTLAASSGALTGATSSAFNVTAGAATALAVTTQPTAGQSGAVLTPSLVVRMVDANGNTVPTTGTTITAALASGAGTVGGTLTAATVSGVATFSNLVLTGTAGSYTINLSAPALTSVTTGAIALTAGAPASLAFQVQPSSVASGAAISPAVVVRVLDGGGNLVPTATNAISIGLGANPGASTLSGTTSVNAVGGVATFSTLSLNRTGSGYTLAASAAGLTGATSAAFAVTPGAAARLAYLVQPANVAAGSAISPAMQVEILDAADNRVTTATSTVSLALAANPGSSTLGGVTSVAAVSGVATFNSVTLNRVATGYTLAATAAGVTPDTSAAFAVTPGAAAALAVTTMPATGQSGLVLSPQPVIRVVDANGNTVTSGGVSVTAALASGAGTLGGTLVATAVGGIATFTNLALSGTAGGYTINFSSGGLTSVTGGTIALSAGAPAALAFQVQPSAVTAGAVMAPAVQVRVVDGAGNTVTTATNTVALALGANPGSSTLGGTTSAAAVAGVATFSSLTLDRSAAGYTLAASSTGLTGATSAAFTVNPGTASTLVVSTAPTTAQSGVLLAPQPAVRLVDALGNTVPTTGTSVTTALASGAGTLGGTLTANTVSGVATFTNLVLTGTAGSYSLSFASTGLTGVASGPIALGAGAPAALAFVQQPSTVTAGNAIAPPVTVRVVDGAGNTVTTATNTVTVAIGSNPGGSTLGGTASVAAVSGVATFGTLTLDRSGAGYTLTAAATGLTSALSAGFTVNPGAATALAITTAPTAGQSGSPVTPQPVVRLVDANGNTVPTSGTLVTATLASGTGNLTGATATTVNGVATFTTLTFTGTAGNISLAFNTLGLAGATTGLVPIAAGAPAALEFTTQPTNSTAGVAITPPVRVRVLDAAGNVVTAATTAITVGIGTNPGGGTLGGTVTLSATSGVAQFNGLSVDRSGTGYTLVANGGGLTPATSAAFNITPAAATRVAFVVPPSAVTAGASIAPAVQVEVQDALGNRVTGSTASITVAIGTNPAAGTLSGAATLNAVAGVATFSNLSINRSGVGYTLTAATGGLTGATSSAFAVDPGAASALAITTMPAGGQSGAPLSPQPVIRLVDALGNTVPTTGTVVTAAIASGTGTLGGTLTASTTNGVATFANLSLSGTAGNFTLNFSSAPLTSVTSGAIAVTAGAPAALAFQVQPSNVASGASIAPAVQVRVVDGAGNLVGTATNSVTISLASNPSGGVLGGTLTAAAVAGVATFSNLTIDRAGTGYALGAAGTGLTPSTSAAFNVAAGAATRLAFLTQPATTTAGTAFSPAVQVEILDAVGNRVTTSTSTVTIALGTNPGGSTLGGTVSVNAVAGVASFAGVSLNRTGTGYTLDATSSGLTPASSAAFDITPGAPAVLVFGTQPTGSSVGATIAPPVTVRIQDASGNLTASTATVSLIFGANPGTATLGGTASRAAVGGIATFNDLTVSAAGAGYTLAASSTGLTGATSAAFTIGAAASTTAILSDLPDPSVVGQAVTVGYQVTSAGGSPTGNVTVSDGAGTSCVGTVAAGSCALTFLGAGARTLTATYAGDANFSGSASAGVPHAVGQAATTSIVATHTPDPSSSGASVSVTWTVSATAPGAGTPTGNVTVSDGVNTCVAAVGAGGCSVALTTVGARSLTATYAGDANFSGSVSPAVSHTVSLAATTTTITSDLPDPSVTGQLVTVNYAVSTAIGTPTGNVTVSDGIGGSCVAAAGAGSCSLTFATAGARTLTATYAGDANFAGSASAGTPHQVDPAPTTTGITSDLPDPSVTGEPVPVNFTVTSTGGTPTGTVNVTDGVTSCSASVAVGSCNLVFPTAGARTITATYLGDANFAGSASAGETHLVSQASTSTTITSDLPDPSTTSESVVVLWTVAVAAPGAGTPTGDVTVTDGVDSCTAAVAAGGCSVTLTTSGTRSLVATYTGDAQFAGGSSVAVAHTVN